MSRGRPEGHVGTQRAVWKVIRNISDKRQHFMHAQACSDVGGDTWGNGSTPGVLAAIWSAAVFLSRRDAHPAKPMARGPNKKCHFQWLSLGKVTSSAFPGPAGILVENSSRV